MLRKYVILALALALAVSARATTIVGLTSDNQLVRFDHLTPSIIDATVDITGLAVDEVITSIDFNVVTGELLGLSSQNLVHIINPLTGATTLLGDGSPVEGLDGLTKILEVNPLLGDLQLLDNLGNILSLNAITGVVQTLLDLLGGYLPGDANFGSPFEIINAAFDNSFTGEVTETTLFIIDKANQTLATLTDGLVDVLHSVGDLNVDGVAIQLGKVGFDIVDNATGFLTNVLNTDTSTSLFSIDLLSGDLVLLGPILDLLQDITVVSPAPSTNDTDGDGVLNSADQCPNTPALTTVDEKGCAINQLCPCAGPRSGGEWEKKGFKKCIKVEAKRFFKAAILTKTERKAVIKSAKGASCGN